MQLTTRFKTLAAFAALTLYAATGANAALVGVSPAQDLTNNPFTIELGNGASYSFANAGEAGFFGPLPSLQTGANARALVSQAFLGERKVSAFFTTSVPGADTVAVNGSLDTGGGLQYEALPDLLKIDSTSDSYIALAFDLDDGTHYGFARLNGTFLSTFAYNDVAGADAQTGAPFAPIPSIAPVPLPATAPLLALAAAGFVALRRRRRAA